MIDTIPLSADSDGEFAGFEHLDANFVYCPNQFFDYCMPRLSRGAFRLVSYILYQTLRHLDENGNPVSEDIAIPFSRLVREARISRGAIRSAIDEAIAERLIVCISEGRKDRREERRAVGEYRIAWDDPSNSYTVNAEQFNGFFAGEGYRTPTPHAFFTQVVTTQTAAATKIVGAVVRHTVEFQTKHGGRRKESALSYRFLGEYTGLSSKRSLNDGIKDAIEAGFIHRTVVGDFIPGKTGNQPSCYGLRWLAAAEKSQPGSKRIPESEPVQKRNHDQFNFGTGTGSISVPEPVQYRYRKTSSKLVPIRKNYKKKLLNNKKEGLLLMKH